MPIEPDDKANSSNNDNDDKHMSQGTDPERGPSPIPTSAPAPASERLCNTCKSLNLTPAQFYVLPWSDTKNTTDNTRIKLGSITDIERRSYCPFCRLILKALFKDEIVHTLDGEPLEAFMRLAPGVQASDIRCLALTPETPSGQLFADLTKCNVFPTITLLSDDAPGYLRSQYPTRLLEDKIDFKLVKNWLAMCQENHGKICSQPKLISHDIKDPALEIPSFRLIDVVDNCIVSGPHNPLYIALTYVWGKVDITKILRLLKSNITELTKPGALAKEEYYGLIPLTIQDAMVAVRELDIRYLWTDSLCIIQDDIGPGSTKMDAISKMDLVYGAAYATIIAASGSDANAGLPGLHAGSRGVPQPIVEISPGFRLAIAQKTGDQRSISSHSSRAWTFQETFFSKRTITFIGGQVVFECLDEQREDAPLKKKPNSESVGQRRNNRNYNSMGDWISNYAGLSLTLREDIYHAFAGFMRYYKTTLGINLCHGIIDKLFDCSLLWTPLYAQTRQRDAPSWSWSGWSASPTKEMWTWESSEGKSLTQTLRERTWIIWYQRKAHDSEDCTRVWTPKNNQSPEAESPGPKNFYGGHVKERFPFDCTRTEPTRRLLPGAPEYIPDTYNPNPRSGFLQFWTVSAMFRLDQASSPPPEIGSSNGYTQLGIFGKGDRELGIIFVHPDWCRDNIPKVHEFILICEGRHRTFTKSGPQTSGWLYLVMLIQWHGDWAERVAVGWIGRKYLTRALGDGPMWKEIILG